MSATQKTEVLTPVSRGENRIEFVEGVSDGPVWLYGRVVWGSEEAKKARTANRIQVWVNGFPQVETTLAMPPGAGLEGRFQAGLLLNGKENRIEVKLPGIARAAGDPPTFSVACRNPEQRQRLHLLIIGVGSETEEELKARALQALHGEMVPGSKVAFKTPAFRSGILHFTLCRDVRIERVLYQLERIRLEIKPLSDATRFPIGTEVVVIYYQGGIWIDDGKAVLQLRRGGERNNKDVISFQDLRNSFAGTRGATLCLLDVNGDAQVATAAALDGQGLPHRPPELHVAQAARGPDARNPGRRAAREGLRGCGPADLHPEAGRRGVHRENPLASARGTPTSGPIRIVPESCRASSSGSLRASIGNPAG